ncbi:hypothetical protein SS50377_21786 [Spironucleus salmonicida]|uniref:Uncharacterized protein n=1 Tax=Spironucleus salmonicida TaxID=348837 RepID=A0A9P8LXV3_9EUKA|nr:hypothetical protein SS50377_21786 [Spironucleus salmonicida]
MENFFSNFGTNNHVQTYNQSAMLKQVRSELEADRCNSKIQQNFNAETRKSILQEKQKSSIDFSYSPSSRFVRKPISQLSFSSSSVGYKIQRK